MTADHLPRARLTAIGLLTAAAWTIGALAAAPASAQEQDPEDAILRYDMTVDLQDDGSADVTLDLDFDFADSPNHGPYLTYVVKQRFDDTQDRVYRMTDFRATSTTGAPGGAETEESGALLVVRIGDEDEEVRGVHSYQVTYRVEGWVNSAELTGEDVDALNLNVLGGWEVPVEDISVTFTGPQDVVDVACFAGIRESEEPCRVASSDGRAATFQHDVVAPGDHLTTAATFPAGTFGGVEPILQERWAMGRAFVATPSALGLTALVTLFGGVMLTRRARQSTRDEQYLGLTPGLMPAAGQQPTIGRRGRAPVTVQFTPPAGFKPGQIGTLVDETADPHDVTATLIDLAVRGYLRIEQTEAPDARGKGGAWQLVRLDAKDDVEPLPFEQQLLEEVFAGRGTVALEDLRTTFAASMAKVQTSLYDDVTARGWFRGNPRTVRWTWLGWSVALLVVGVLVTAGLAIWTSLGLVGLPLVVLGIASLALTGSAPSRTAEGTAVLAQAQGFRQYLATAEANQLRFEEGEDLFSRYLPYAVAFGLTERWAKAFADLAAQGRELPVPGWYVGSMYGHALFWSDAHGFTRDLTSFTRVAEAAISAPTPGSSGASGMSGGFSGGGVGGGGGGSW